MDSKSSFAVLLTIMVLGGALVELDGRPLESWMETSNLNDYDDVEDADKERVMIPAFLHNYVSTLDAEKIKQYAALLEENTLGQHSSEFCQDAQLMCDSNIAIEDDPNAGISIEDSDEDDEMFEDISKLDDEGKSLSFVEEDILKGQDIVFPERLHQSTYSSPLFLPHSLAEKMPFSSEKVLELMDFLHISHKSKLATMMSRTVSRCKLTKEKVSKETTLTKEKEIKEKDIKEKKMKGEDSIEEEKTGKETENGYEFGDGNRSEEKEIKEKETEVKEEKSSDEKEIKDIEVKKKEIGWKKDEKTKGMYNEGEEDKDKRFKYKEFKEKEVEKKRLNEKKEKLSKEKEIKDKEIKKMGTGWRKDKETKGKYNEGEEDKNRGFKEKEFEKNELQEKKEKSSMEIEIKKKDIDWNKEEESEGKYKDGDEGKKEEFKEKEVEKKEVKGKKEKWRKEKEIKKKESGWKKGEDIKGKYTEGKKNEEKEFKEKETKDKEVEVKKQKSIKEKVHKEKDIEVRREKSSKETLKCVTSLEGMTSFVKNSLPAEKHIKALQTSSFTKLVKGDHKKIHWKVSAVKKHEKVVVCKKELFPFAVFKCHAIGKTKGMRFYYIKLESNDGVHRKEVVACNDKKKSQKLQPGNAGTSSESKVPCHWITDSLIWVPDI